MSPISIAFHVAGAGSDLLQAEEACGGVNSF
jgi:hypothetical protein